LPTAPPAPRQTTLVLQAPIDVIAWPALMLRRCERTADNGTGIYLPG
jgi:hypothetical protein